MSYTERLGKWIRIVTVPPVLADDDLKEQELPETESDYLSHLYPETASAKPGFIKTVYGRLITCITQESSASLKTNIILKTS